MKKSFIFIASLMAFTACSRGLSNGDIFLATVGEVVKKLEKGPVPACIVLTVTSGQMPAGTYLLVCKRDPNVNTPPFQDPAQQGDAVLPSGRDGVLSGPSETSGD